MLLNICNDSHCISNLSKIEYLGVLSFCIIPYFKTTKKIEKIIHLIIFQKIGGQILYLLIGFQNFKY